MLLFQYHRRRFYPARPLPVLVLAFCALWIQGCATSHQEVASKRLLMVSYDQEMKQNQLAAARKILLQGVRQYPREPLFWNDLAYLSFREGNYADADKMLSEGLRISPENQHLLLNEVRLDLARGKVSDGRKILFGMLPRHPWVHGYRLLLAITEVKSGNPEAGRILFEDLHDHHPHDPLIRRYIKDLTRTALPSGPPKPKRTVLSP